MPCPNCHYPNSNPNAKFCARCGAPLSGAPKTQAMPQSGAKLVIQTPGRAPYEVALSQPTHTIGRVQGNDIVIPDPFVGGQHARLEQVGSTYRIVDLQSKNGTSVNGQRIQQQILNAGDVIRIGDIFGNSVGLTFTVGGVVAARQPVTLNLRQTVTKIGRASGNDLTLNDALVSANHAQIQFNGQQHILTDLGSTNGTYINGARLTPHQPWILHSNDLVQIGAYQFRYDRSGMATPTQNEMRLDGERLSVQRGRKLILNDVTIPVLPREFVCLVGASGAGKSTLMNALSGYRRAEQGQVLINGADFYASYDAFRSRIGYVPQDDILHKGIPVRRALRYAAELRLPPGTDLDARVENVIQMVELTERKDEKIQNLSGGQRKRASIAVELLAEPGLFFLDEPTSGLDPGLEKKLMERMRFLADHGQTVILVTHATQNIMLSNFVAFMSSARLVFFGRPHEALAFFGKQDFADIYLELAGKDPADAKRIAESYESKFKQSAFYQANIAQRARPKAAAPAIPPPRPKPPFWKQWWVLSRRQLDLIVRDWLTLFILVLVLPIIGLFTWPIAKQDFLVGLAQDAINKLDSYSPAGDAQKLIFIMALAAVLLGIFAGAYEIIREQAIYKREHMVNLDIAPYIFSKTGVLFLFALIQAALFLGIIALRVELPEKGIFMWGPLEMYVTLLIAAVSSIALGLFISSLAQSENMVIYIILLVLFLQILFAGVIFELPDEAKLLSKLTTTHWTIDALGSTADIPALHAKTKFPEPELPPNVPPPEKQKPPDLPIAYAHEGGHLLGTWFVLATFASVFLGLTVLRQKAKDEPGPITQAREFIKSRLKP